MRIGGKLRVADINWLRIARDVVNPIWAIILLAFSVTALIVSLFICYSIIASLIDHLMW